MKKKVFIALGVLLAGMSIFLGVHHAKAKGKDVGKDTYAQETDKNADEKKKSDGSKKKKDEKNEAGGVSAVVTEDKEQVEEMAYPGITYSGYDNATVKSGGQMSLTNETEDERVVMVYEITDKKDNTVLFTSEEIPAMTRIPWKIDLPAGEYELSIKEMPYLDGVPLVSMKNEILLTVTEE